MIQGDVEKRLLEALEKGTTARLACEYAGVDESVYYDEIKRNPEFAKATTRARVKRLPVALDSIFKSGEIDWRAHAKWLELAFPRDFGVQRHELTGAEGGAITFTLDFGRSAKDET